MSTTASGTPATAQPSMSFGQAITTVFSKYADFTGRASRPEFWWFALFSWIVGAVLGALNFATPRGVIAIGTALAAAWSAAVLIPSLAVAVRRLRDAGRSWAELFWLLLPIVGLIILIVHLCDPSKPVTGQA